MLNFNTSGKGKEMLVLLHGFMEDNTIWEDMEPFLSENFTLIKIDLPGHGKSEIIAEVQTMELMAEEVKRVTDYIGLEKFHLLGHSMGGYTSLAFADKFPEKLKSLTLFFSTFYGDDEEKRQTRIKSYRIIQEAFPNYVNAGIPNFFSKNELDELQDKVALAKSIALSTDNLGALACMKGMIERTDKKNVIDSLESTILVIAGKFDNAINVTKLFQGLPDRKNVKSYMLDCGHNGHWEKPKICAEIINTELLK